MLNEPIEFIPPILLSSFFPLFKYFQNINEADPSYLWLPWLLSTAISLTAYLLFARLFKSKIKACFLSLTLVGAIFTFGYALLLSLSLIICFMIIAFWPGWKRFLDRRAVRILSIITLLMVTIPSFMILTQYWISSVTANTVSSIKQTGNTPDIYYIVLEGYSGDKGFESMGLTNQGFDEFLKEKGFYVTSESFGNYSVSDLSLAGSLNMCYWDQNGLVLDDKYLKNVIDNNQIQKVLKEKGYQYTHIGSDTFPLTSLNHNANKNYEYHTGNLIYNEYSVELYRTTVFSLVSNTISPPDTQSVSRESILFQLNILDKIASERNINDQPNFVFCHIPLPDKNGAIFNTDGTFPTNEQTKRSFKENYFNNVTYLNGRLESLVNKLLSDNSNLPIIILQGNEGLFSPDFEKLKNKGIKQESNIPVDWVQQSASILNTLYFPGISREIFYPTLSPVNDFRLLLKIYFDSNDNLLPDKYFVPKIYDNAGQGYRSNDFYDATESLNLTP